LSVFFICLSGFFFVCAYLLFFQVEKDARSDDDLSGPEEEKPEINKHGDGVMVDNKKKQ